MSLYQQLRKHAPRPSSAATNLFLLAEASTHSGLLGRLEFHQAHHCCLWHLERSPSLERHAPMLFQLIPDSDLDTWLGTLDDTFAFTLLETAMALDALALHLRRFGKVQHGQQRYFLRLGDPRSLSLYVGSLAHQPNDLARLFGNGRISELHFHDATIGLALGVQPLFEQPPEQAQREGCLAWRAAPREVAP